jgi:hypothetical protein
VWIILTAEVVLTEVHRATDQVAIAALNAAGVGLVPRLLPGVVVLRAAPVSRRCRLPALHALLPVWRQCGHASKVAAWIGSHKRFLTEYSRDEVQLIWRHLHGRAAELDRIGREAAEQRAEEWLEMATSKIQDAGRDSGDTSRARNRKPRRSGAF